MLTPTGLHGHVRIDAGDRRESTRVPGPFDGWRLDVLDTPVRIYDISLGGCFVHAMHDQRPGVEVYLTIELPGEGSVDLHAETLYVRPGFGFAVRFIDLDAEVSQKLERVLESLKDGVRRPS